MTTLPTPLFIVLLCLSLPTLCRFVVLGFVVYRMVRREKSSTEQLHKSIDRYLKQTGGKKWNMH